MRCCKLLRGTGNRNKDARLSRESCYVSLGGSSDRSLDYLPRGRRKPNERGIDAFHAKQSRDMKRLDGALKGASVETSEEDAVLREYELKRRMARERAVIPREITGAPDDST